MDDGPHDERTLEAVVQAGAREALAAVLEAPEDLRAGAREPHEQREEPTCDGFDGSIGAPWRIEDADETRGLRSGRYATNADHGGRGEGGRLGEGGRAIDAIPTLAGASNEWPKEEVV